MWKNSVLVLFALLDYAYGLDVDYNGICISKNYQGRCIFLDECNHYLLMLKASHATENNVKVRQLLTEVNCGYDRTRPKVCCPLQNAEPSTTTRLNLKSRSKINAPPDISNHPNLHLLPTNCGEYETERIIAGNKTGLLEFPWMARIGFIPEPTSDIDYLCGGSIINDRYILTAAHCVVRNPPVTIRIGEYDTKTDSDCEGPPDDINCAPPLQDIDIESVLIHPNYTASLKQNDIALIRLSTPIQMTDNALPICLPLSESLRNMDLIGTDMLVTGWGQTEKQTRSDVLLKARISVVDISKCINGQGRSRVFYKQLCVGGQTNQDSCIGDSGGPLMMAVEVNEVVRIVQQGIVSFGKTCGVIGTPAVYTSVIHYMDWILDRLLD